MNQAQQAFEPDDIFLEQRITEVHLVQGHPVAACTVKSIDPQSDSETSAIWLFAVDGSDARRLTYGMGKDNQPRWSADGGQLAFLSDRAGGAPQLHVIELDGGEARPVCHRPRGLVSHAWRPGNQQLAALGSVTVDPDREVDGTLDADPNASSASTDVPQVVWRLPYKLDGVGYVLDTRIHLFLVDLASGNIQALTQGDFDVSGAGWTHDGQAIVYSRKRDQPGQQHCSDIWLLPLQGNQPGTPQRLTFDQTSASSPSCSPDGRWIAFTGAVDEGDAQLRLWLIDRQSGAVRGLGDESIEVVSGDLQWHADSTRMAFVRAHRGLQQVCTIDIPGGTLRTLDSGLRHIQDMRACACMAYTAESAHQPLELYSAEWDGSNERQLSHFNDWWHSRRLPQTELRQFQVPAGKRSKQENEQGNANGTDGGDEETVDGWLLLPANRQGPVPLLVDIHGGPASYAFLRFPNHAYWQVMCSRGWAVLALNAVGSSSYGREFADRLLARWGELDLPQHQAAIDSLRQQGLADDRVAIIGSSYGGYLSAWATGLSRTFRAAVVCAPVGNLEAHYGTSDSGYYADPYSMQHKPEADRDLMARLSPMSHIEKSVTPTLFLQGTDDQRCPVGQAEEMFVKLKRAGRAPTRMVLYPGGSHHVYGEGKPSHRLDALKRICAWLERWVDQPLQDDQQR